MSEGSGAGNPDGSRYTLAPSLPLTDDERAAIDDEIQGIPERMRRRAIIFERPRFMEEQPHSLAQLDELILEILTRLKPKVPEDVAEKFFDRVMTGSVLDQHEDDQGNIGILCYRLLDTLECMVTIKEKYRGVRRTTKYDKKHATEQLRARGLLRG